MRPAVESANPAILRDAHDDLRVGFQFARIRAHTKELDRTERRSIGMPCPGSTSTYLRVSMTRGAPVVGRIDVPVEHVGEAAQPLQRRHGAQRGERADGPRHVACDAGAAGIRERGPERLVEARRRPSVKALGVGELRERSTERARAPVDGVLLELEPRELGLAGRAGVDAAEGLRARANSAREEPRAQEGEPVFGDERLQTTASPSSASITSPTRIGVVVSKRTMSPAVTFSSSTFWAPDSGAASDQTTSPPTLSGGAMRHPTRHASAPARAHAGRSRHGIEVNGSSLRGRRAPVRAG